MEITEAQEFLKNNHRGVLVARKKDGSLQMTVVSPVIDAEGKVIITSRETTFKVKPLPAFEWVTTIYCGSSHSGCTPRRAAGVKGGEAAEPCEGPLDGSQHRGQMAVR